MGAHIHAYKCLCMHMFAYLCMCVHMYAFVCICMHESEFEKKEALVFVEIYKSLKCPTRIMNITRIPDILPTTKKSVILVVDCSSSSKKKFLSYIDMTTWIESSGHVKTRICFGRFGSNETIK